MLSLTVPVPCIRGQYGNKIYTFQTTVKPTEIESLLGHDPRSKKWNKLSDKLANLYEQLQRKTASSRSKSTARYICERIAPESPDFLVGAFPAISIGMIDPPIFESYDEAGKQVDSNIGILRFDLSANNTRVLLDGLARITGAMDLIDEGKSDALSNFTFPVTIYAPTEQMGQLSVEKLGQIFHDFNFLATPVSKSQAIALDKSDLYIMLTNQIGNSPTIESRGGMVQRMTKNSKALVTQQNLLKFVRGACEGTDFQKNLRKAASETSNLTTESFEAIKKKIEKFLGTIANHMGDDDFKRQDYIHLTSPGWCALGLIFYDMEIRLGERLTEDEKENIRICIAKIDWSRYNPVWLNFLGKPEIDEKGNQRLGKSVGGGAAIKKLADYIREQTGLNNSL